jgi:hypothetical protein
MPEPQQVRPWDRTHILASGVQAFLMLGQEGSDPDAFGQR